jgi:hypothetical protein
MVNIELEFWDWFSKIIEKGTFIRKRVIDKKDITDDDYSLFKPFFKIWRNGEYPLYANKLDIIAESAVQIDIFDSTTVALSVNPASFDDARDDMIDGKVIEDVPQKPKSKKK